MNRREIALDVLIGVLLVVVFATIVGAGVGAIGLALYAVSQAVKHLLPGLPDSVVFYGLCGLLLLISEAIDLRKRHWRNAFLSLAAIAMIVSIFLARADSMFGTRGFAAVLAISVAIPADSDLTPAQFLGSASILFAVVAINAGLLGSGALARIVSDCVLVGVFVWFAIDLRRRWSALQNPGTRAPLSQTRV